MLLVLPWERPHTLLPYALLAKPPCACSPEKAREMLHCSSSVDMWAACNEARDACKPRASWLEPWSSSVAAAALARWVVALSAASNVDTRAVTPVDELGIVRDVPSPLLGLALGTGRLSGATVLEDMLAWAVARVARC